MSFENEFSYTATQFEVVLGVFTLTAAVFAAVLVYSLATSGSIAPRYRLTSYLTGVVMVSAVIELGLLAMRWSTAFDWDGSMYSLAGDLFSNGFRYMNWSIDVPVLLTQLLIVAGITGAVFRKRWAAFVIAGLAMIWTGYIGQFDEINGGAQFWLWGAISTVFYLWLLYVAWQTIQDAKEKAPAGVRKLFQYVWILFLVSWTIYPLAYLMPQISATANGVVIRNLIYSFADIASKAVYGVLLAIIAQKMSAAAGFKPAIEAEEAFAEAQ
ncbi:MAG: bacteriorhodopsin [Acidimicrobiia bacterium]|nr:bacteriorhodopsin [Acidimicrobiia bacterium]NNF70142.1 bacteriorhodopsin [Acidimicrobiia bacterium]